MSAPNTRGPNARSSARFFGRLLGASGIVVGAWAAYASVEARWVRIERTTLRDSRVPPGLDGIRLLFASDIHAGPAFGTSRMTALVRMINAEEPDIVVLGGDYVGGRSSGGGERIFYPAVAGLEAQLGVFAVLGNHDAWEGRDAAYAGMAAAGITVLENELVRAGHGGEQMVIAGLADEWTGWPDAAPLASQVAAGEYAVLVAHNPDSFDTALANRPNPWALALAGHTHGGQVRGAYELLGHRPTRFGKRYLSGWAEEHGTPVLVSNGVGAVGLPLRTLAPAQMHVITLEHSSGR